jgi:hypothetical protein
VDRRPLARDAARRHARRDGGAREVDPALAYDAAATVREALRLRAELQRPNLMVKIPATTAGLAAVDAQAGDVDRIVFPAEANEAAHRRDRPRLTAPVVQMSSGGAIVVPFSRERA